MRKNRRKLVAEGLGIVLLASVMFSAACGGKMAEVDKNSSKPVERIDDRSEHGSDTGSNARASKY